MTVRWRVAPGVLWRPTLAMTVLTRNARSEAVELPPASAVLFRAVVDRSDGCTTAELVDLVGRVFDDAPADLGGWVDATLESMTELSLIDQVDASGAHR